MIEPTRGDILKADAEALVNTVNCDGFMGRGIALQFKNAYPANFRAYATACKRNEVQPGRMLVFETGSYVNPRFIVNFPTKRHWRGKSRLVDIESGLAALTADVERLGIRSIAIPPLGCGLGGLDWTDVRPRIERAFASLPAVSVLLFEPIGAPRTDRMTRPSLAPEMTVGRAVLVSFMERYRSALLDPFITLLEVHKLLYFGQASGEPLRLRYTKGPYGPYAENLRHVLSAIEGHFVRGFADGGEAPEKSLELLPGSTSRASAVLAEHVGSLLRFERVASLVQGFESPFGLELLSTVHWVVEQEQARTAAEVEQAVYRWSDRKRRFSPAQIRLAWERLGSEGWFSSTPAVSAH